MEFSADQIKEFLEKALGEQTPVLSNLIDITLFISKVSKGLISTLTDKNLNATEKLTLTLSVSETIVNELEMKTIISLELANEFRNTLKNGQSISNMLSSFSDFTEKISEAIPAELVNDKKIGPWVKLFQTCLTSFTCKKSVAESPKPAPIESA